MGTRMATNLAVGSIPVEAAAVALAVGVLDTVVVAMAVARVNDAVVEVVMDEDVVLGGATTMAVGSKGAGCAKVTTASPCAFVVVIAIISAMAVDVGGLLD